MTQASTWGWASRSVTAWRSQVELHGFADRPLVRVEERRLRLVAAGAPAHRFEDRSGLHALVHMERHGRDLETRPLRLPGPLERRVEMRVEGVLPRRTLRIGFRRDQPDGRVVRPLPLGVLVSGDGLPARRRGRLRAPALLASQDRSVPPGRAGAPRRRAVECTEPDGRPQDRRPRRESGIGPAAERDNEESYTPRERPR